MRSEASTLRWSSLTATATTLVAMAVMSIPAASGGYGQIECRATIGEAHAVRGVVAAVVAGLARELLGTEPSGSTAAIIAAVPAGGLRLEPALTTAPPVEHPAGLRLILAERLLDLPPPAC